MQRKLEWEETNKKQGGSRSKVLMKMNFKPKGMRRVPQASTSPSPASTAGKEGANKGLASISPSCWAQGIHAGCWHHHGNISSHRRTGWCWGASPCSGAARNQHGTRGGAPCHSSPGLCGTCTAKCATAFAFSEADRVAFLGLKNHWCDRAHYESLSKELPCTINWGSWKKWAWLKHFRATHV